MKKLLVTAIGAAAALGASAAGISTQRFENVTGELPQAATISSLNTLAGGNFWSGDEPTNTYTYISCAGEDFPTLGMPVATPTKALEVKTTFGSPLTLNAIAGGSSTNIPASGIYFDSLVKFTVCEEAPEQTYEGAKIIMWLEEEYASDGDTILGTNIMVRAGYVNANGTCTPMNFVCKQFRADIDAWHRVTIKTWADITNGSGIPGFAIFIDNELVNTDSEDGTMADAIAANLTEAAGYFGKTQVFASLVQGDAIGKMTITSASFDGTGKLTDLVFTDEAPFTAAEDYVAPQAAVTINGVPVEGIKTLAEAVAAVNGAAAEQSVTFQLSKGMTLDGTLVFASPADVVLDFAGCVLTNESDSVAAISVATLGDATFTITNTTEAVGGIYCADDGAALAFVSGELAIYAGIFDGEVQLDAGVDVYGGSYKDDTNIVDYLIPGKTISEIGATYPGLYDVIDAKYKVIFVYGQKGEYAATNDNLAADAEMPLPPAEADITGYTTTWTPALPSTVQADGTYTASYSADTYTITFNANGGSVDPATTNFTIASGAIVLPTATTSLIGVEFAGWTNATITSAITSFTPTAADLANFTLYAKWDAVAPSVITFETGRNDATVTPATTNFWAGGATITLPTPVIDPGVVGVTFVGWTNTTITTAITEYTPPAADAASFTLYAEWEVTGSGSFDGGDGNSFTIDAGAQAMVAEKTGHALTDTVTGTTMTYAQAYALGLVDTTTGVVADLDATIEIKDGKVVVGLSSTPLNYTITLKVYEKSSLAAESWTLKATYTLDSETATTGFTPSAGTSNFYKTEVTISNK